MTRYRQGFTLIELLLGITIFSIISVSIYATFSAGINLSRRSEEDQRIYREARWTFDLLSREFENMVPFDLSGSYTEKNAFIGEDDKITFVSPLEGHLEVISYYLSSPDNGEVFKTVIGQTYKKNVDIVTRYEESYKTQYLVRESMDLRDFLNDSDEKEIEIISMSIQENGLQFQYGYAEGEDSDDASMTWEDTWEASDIPLNVRVTIDFLPDKPEREALSLTRDILIPHGFLGET